MPTVNVFYNKAKPDIQPMTLDIKDFLMEKLSNSEIKLTLEEISVRFIQIEGEGMIGSIEIEITAHEFAERVKKQDDICRDLRTCLMNKYPALGDIRIWLILAQLGHSW